MSVPASDAEPSPLAPLLISAFPKIKHDFPTEGRRKWLLRTADEFWRLPADAAQRLAASTPSDAVPLDDDDPYDGFTTDAPTLGVIVRTDYTNENAWDTFLERLRSAEADIAVDAPADPQPSANAAAPSGATDVDESDSDSDSGTPGSIFTLLSPPSPDSRAALSGISNLAALRLLTDVDIARAPARPRDAAPAPVNRLIGRNGFQEIYEGKQLWIYDARSNTDQSARVVSPRGETYGTATGDSWRARVSHLPELQVNMATGAIRIDFGGLDRYDAAERARNLVETEPPNAAP